MKDAIILVLASLGLSACLHNGGAKTSWEQVVRKCAESDLNGPEVLYFGPSNSIGPGSVWRLDSTKTYRLRWDLNSMPADPRAFVKAGNSSSCNGQRNKALKLGVSVAGSIPVVSAEATLDFSKASKVTVKASEFAWQSIVEGPYEAYLDDLPQDTPLRIDLSKPERYVLTRALLISGYEAELEFDSDIGASLEPKYNGPLGGNSAANVGGSLTATWEGQTKLLLKSEGDFFIAGELRPYLATGLASGTDSRFGEPVSIGANSSADRNVER